MYDASCNRWILNASKSSSYLLKNDYIRNLDQPTETAIFFWVVQINSSHLNNLSTVHYQDFVSSFNRGQPVEFGGHKLQEW